MSLSVNVPALTGPLALTAGETAVGIGTQKLGTLAQVSGLGIGFDVFTPTANAAYRLTVRGQDSATGTPTNAYIDELVVTSYGGTVAITVLHSTTIAGAPAARTWSNNMGALKVADGSGTTWYVDVAVLRFPA